MTDSWVEALERFKKGKIDIMAGIVPTVERQKHINFTASYLDLPTVIVAKKDTIYPHSLSELEGLKVGTIKGFSLAESISKDYPNIQLVGENSAIEGLKQLQQGQLDAYVGSLVVINKTLDEMKDTELFIASFTQYNLAWSMAVREGLEPLVPIINKVLMNMSAKEKSAIANS